ncbi:putative lipase serine esterase [Phaeomoniella chlamydospora]|uniref:Putative lipase serine esterase n=1 Tax=Phaeomoniella chlamydospora TaxID=158046 RepID=A0A0G2F015_PHACM|nr:putative lipase serine esterase [Phaeomoniella chlamydospora]
MADDTRKSGGGNGKADHLCVLVHGLWGNPTHLDYVASALRNKYGEEQLIILTVKRNAGSFTYDGIELGGERVAKEIEETLEALARDGYQIKKLSVVGYSLGGLISRYAIGLLHAKGYFDKIKPVNFTTFVTPHLGVRTPLKGYSNHIWNVLGARTLSMSGRQLFMIDKFRNTGRPLLSVLADPDSIFIRALSRFEHRCVYANVVNDKSAVYYTTGISKNDPFTNLDKVEVNYLNGYEPVIINAEDPVKMKDEALPSFYSRFAGGSQTFLRNLPPHLALIILVPIGFIAFLINTCIQTIRSRRRIKLHESISQDEGYSGYHVPYIIQDVRQAVEDVFENVNAAHSQEYLADGSEEMADIMAEANLKPTDSLPAPLLDQSDSVSEKTVIENDALVNAPQDARQLEFPTLALAPAQFAMIKALDDVGFRRYPVYIHKHRHSHAAIIVRTPRPDFEEGKIVISHWLKEEFKI